MRFDPSPFTAVGLLENRLQDEREYQQRLQENIRAATDQIGRDQQELVRSLTQEAELLTAINKLRTFADTQRRAEG